MAPATLRFCSTCQDETAFEVVVFDDGLGADGECACVECGSAVVVGIVVDLLAAHPEVVRAAA